MASVRDIRNHIRSVTSIRKITGTMEMVSAARMRKATAALFASRPYAALAWKLLLDVSSKTEPELHPLLQSRPVTNTLIVVVTSDRGLCGAFNMNVIHRALEEVTDRAHCQFVAVGKKGRDFLMRRGYEVIAEFAGLPVPVPFIQTLPIGRLVIEEYQKAAVDRVTIVYSRFVSNLTGRPSVLELLPLKQASHEPEMHASFVYEPSAQEVIAPLLSRIIEYELYAAMLEAQASEFAARMVAMKNATDNAAGLISELVLSYNRVRQENITKELTELSTARAVIEQV